MAPGKPHKPPTKYAHDKPHHNAGKPVSQKTHEEIIKDGEGCLMLIVLIFIVAIIIYLMMGAPTMTKWFGH